MADRICGACGRPVPENGSIYCGTEHEPLPQKPTEIVALRKAQAREVMPIIGPLLDAWQGLPNDVQYMDELTEVSGYMQALEQAMDADPDDCQHTLVQPCDESGTVPIGKPWCIKCGSTPSGGAADG